MKIVEQREPMRGRTGTLMWWPNSTSIKWLEYCRDTGTLFRMVFMFAVGCRSLILQRSFLTSHPDATDISKDLWHSSKVTLFQFTKNHPDGLFLHPSVDNPPHCLPIVHINPCCSHPRTQQKVLFLRVNKAPPHDSTIEQYMQNKRLIPEQYQMVQMQKKGVHRRDLI